MKYRLDERLYNRETNGIKRFIWIEPYYPVHDDPEGFTERYTENYQRINLIDCLKDIQNHQITFDPNHRGGLHND